MFADYPKWIDVDGPGNPQSPGRVLVNNEDEERLAKKNNAGPAYLNPPPDSTTKSLDDMDRAGLVATLTREGIPDSMSDAQIRTAIRKIRKQKADQAKDDAEAEMERDRQANDAGDHGDGLERSDTPEAPDDVQKDAAGDDVIANPADSANRRKPGRPAKSSPAVDTRPDDAQNKVADDTPAGNVTEQAATSPDVLKGSK